MLDTNASKIAAALVVIIVWYRVFRRRGSVPYPPGPSGGFVIGSELMSAVCAV